jgi:hypothetical protein
MAGFGISASMIAAFAGRSGGSQRSHVPRRRRGDPRPRGPETRHHHLASRGERAWRQTLLAALAGSTNLVGTALYFRAGELGLVAIVSPVSALFPLVPILGGYLLLRERLDRPRRRHRRGLPRRGLLRNVQPFVFPPGNGCDANPEPAGSSPLRRPTSRDSRPVSDCAR